MLCTIESSCSTSQKYNTRPGPRFEMNPKLVGNGLACERTSSLPCVKKGVKIGGSPILTSSLCATTDSCGRSVRSSSPAGWPMCSAGAAVKGFVVIASTAEMPLTHHQSLAFLPCLSDVAS